MFVFGMPYHFSRRSACRAGPAMQGRGCDNLLELLYTKRTPSVLQLLDHTIQGQLRELCRNAQLVLFLAESLQQHTPPHPLLSIFGKAGEDLPHRVVLGVPLELLHVVDKLRIRDAARGAQTGFLGQMREVRAGHAEGLQDNKKLHNRQNAGLAHVPGLERPPQLCEGLLRELEGRRENRGALDQLEVPHTIEGREDRLRRGQRRIIHGHARPGWRKGLDRRFHSQHLRMPGGLGELHPRQR
mmetsp:Transcript_143295/g.457898  ORF Transcript_143295/g.457898 Transcript_143295/m.457898 type:complete len:242 (+) Transcript_143295:558-1283(+)